MNSFHMLMFCTKSIPVTMEPALHAESIVWFVVNSIISILQIGSLSLGYHNVYNTSSLILNVSFFSSVQSPVIFLFHFLSFFVPSFHFCFLAMFSTCFHLQWYLFLPKRLCRVPWKNITVPGRFILWMRWKQMTSALTSTLTYFT